jgi:hypothetical protein
VADIAEGDVLLGLASSGVHSNGYSLVRKIVALSRALAGTAGAPFEDGRTLGEALLDANADLRETASGKAIRENGSNQGAGPYYRWRLSRKTFRAFCHPNAGSRRWTSTQYPAQAGLPLAGKDRRRRRQMEMLRTFNCGVGMVLVVDTGRAAEVAAVLRDEGETVTNIGRIAPSRRVMAWFIVGEFRCDPQACRYPDFWPWLEYEIAGRCSASRPTTRPKSQGSFPTAPTPKGLAIAAAKGVANRSC